MSTANFSAYPEPKPSVRLRREGRASVAEGRETREPAPATLAIATLLDESQFAPGCEAIRTLAGTLGVPLDCLSISTQIARGGVVGRISVPAEASGLMERQRNVIGATVGADPLSPVSRLWRGLQRRADVLVDMRVFKTLPGSDAARAGCDRDLLLFSHRVAERTASRRELPSDIETADQWTRARHVAELVYRHASAENRQVLLVLPVGRGTDAQRLFTDALLRQARLQRVAPPRIVKAGLLAALLTGDLGKERLLAASVMSIEEMTATAAEAVGDCGPWPVVSLGQHVTFYDMPISTARLAEPLPLLLVLATMLQRVGHADLARQLHESIVLTLAALMRMREELGSDFSPPMAAFVGGILTNWGRALPHLPSSTAGAQPVVQGLRLRITTTLDAAAVRDMLIAALQTTGIEVGSVRTLESSTQDGGALLEVRLRSGLGEPVIPDVASGTLSSTMLSSMRFVSIEPWATGASGERAKPRATAAS